MARRSISNKQIKEGVFYIMAQLEDGKSMREIANDPNIPFSLTTFYKYQDKYGKQFKSEPKRSNEAQDLAAALERTTPTKTVTSSLEQENKQLLEEINALNRFIVRKYIGGEVTSENRDSNNSVH